MTTTTVRSVTKQWRRLLHAVIMGPPGSGKGTIAKRIVNDFGLSHLSSGDILRQQVVKATSEGQLAQKYIASGALVPDDVVMKLVIAELQSDSLRDKSWLLDGFPRTLQQCEDLTRSERIDVVVNLDVPFDEIINRVKDRFIHEPSGRIYNLVFNPPKVQGIDDITQEPLTQRHDDKREVVLQRLKAYQALTEPIQHFFRHNAIYLNFQGRFTNEIWPNVYNELSKHVQPLSRTEYK